jgi:N-methylhydantoinase B/oxoprolinase/acetone carboxylase alpha subunit
MPIFGVGLINLPAEGNERTKPVLIRSTTIITDSAGPGRWRGGVGIATETELGPAAKTNLAYTCDRERSIVEGFSAACLDSHTGYTSTREPKTDIWEPASTTKSNQASLFGAVPRAEEVMAILWSAIQR